MRGRHHLLLLALVLMGAACAVFRPAWSPAPTRAASFDSSHVDTIAVATLRAYGASLRYDATLGAADSTRLVNIVAGQKSFGPLATIAPESGSFAIDTADLAKGRIIARIWSESSYAKLGLRPGLNYWWIDKKGGRWRSIVVSDTQSVKLFDSVTYHRGYRWRQAIARFVWSDADQQLWGTCCKTCCCAPK